MVDQPGMGTLLGADEYLVKPVDKGHSSGCIQRRAQHSPVLEANAPILSSKMTPQPASSSLNADRTGLRRRHGLRMARKPAPRSPRTNPNS